MHRRDGPLFFPRPDHAPGGDQAERFAKQRGRARPLVASLGGQPCQPTVAGTEACGTLRCEAGVASGVDSEVQGPRADGDTRSKANAVRKADPAAIGPEATRWMRRGGGRNGRRDREARR